MSAPIVHARPEVGDALASLAIARGTMLEDFSAVVYAEALADVEASLVQRACYQLAKLPRREYDSALPSVGAIRERCEAIARADRDAADKARLLPAPKEHAEDDPRTWVFCSTCQDEPSGWQTVWCQGAGKPRDTRRAAPDAMHLQPCGRRIEHPPHSFAVKCRCYPTNPEAARKREQQRVRKV